MKTIEKLAVAQKTSIEIKQSDSHQMPASSCSPEGLEVIVPQEVPVVVLMGSKTLGDKTHSVTSKSRSMADM